MDCTIFIKGKGTSSQGKLKNDWTGTVKEAIKDWDVFYRAVFTHVKDCHKRPGSPCDPTKVLLAYWNLRQRPKHEGKMSGTLANLATRYLRIGASPELVKLFLLDTYNSDLAIKYHWLFSNEELYAAIRGGWIKSNGLTMVDNYGFKRMVKGAAIGLKRKDNPFVRSMLLLMENSIPMPSYDEVEKLAVVVEVTTS